MRLLTFVITAYIAGSLPIGLYVGKLVRGIDIREFGSGNIGASNVWRTLGPKWGVLVFLVDVLKGLLPVCCARYGSDPSGWMPVLTGFAAILGHNASPFLRFKGGKGVATSLGVAIGLSAEAGLIAFGSWFLVLLVTRYISVASLVGVPVGSFLIWWLNGQKLPYLLFGILATMFVFVKHKANLKRLKAGTEPQVEPIIPRFARMVSGKRSKAKGEATGDGSASERRAS